MTAFEEISRQASALTDQLAVLLAAGARAAADDGMSGGEIMLWLTRNGMSPVEASQLCATIVRERRAARQAAEVTL